MQKIGGKLPCMEKLISSIISALDCSLPLLGGHGIISSPWNEITQEAQSHCSNLFQGCQKKKKKKNWLVIWGLDFPGGPVAKNPCSQCRELGFSP